MLNNNKVDILMKISKKKKIEEYIELKNCAVNY